MAVDDSYTKTLFHMDGADASTTFTDESGKVWTTNGNAQIDTAQSVFGGASGLFDGTGDYLSLAENTDFDFGTGDFTIDLRVRRNGNNTNYNGLVSTHHYVEPDSNGWGAGFDNGNKVRFTNNGDTKVTSTTTLTDLTWYHVAYVRYGNTLSLYVNGTSEDTDDVTGVSFNSYDGITIGRWGANQNNYYLVGWLDEVRVSKGVARWTTNFTPPTRAYYPGGGLMLFSS